MKTRQYVIYRKGSNAANQPCEFGWLPVFLVEAASVAAAKAASLDAGLTCYNGQILDARPASRVSHADWDAAWSATERHGADMAALVGFD